MWPPQYMVRMIVPRFGHSGASGIISSPLPGMEGCLSGPTTQLARLLSSCLVGQSGLTASGKPDLIRWLLPSVSRATRIPLITIEKHRLLDIISLANHFRHISTGRSKDRAKTSRSWLYPCFYRKYILDDIQGSYLRVMVDSKGIEPSTSAMRKDLGNFFGSFPLFLAVSTGFHFICKTL